MQMGEFVFIHIDSFDLDNSDDVRCELSYVLR